MSLALWAQQSAGKGREGFCKKSIALGDYFSKDTENNSLPSSLTANSVLVSTNLPLSSTLRCCKDIKQSIDFSEDFYIYQPGRLRLIQLQIKAKALAMPGEPCKCIFQKPFLSLCGLDEAAHNLKMFGKLWGSFSNYQTFVFFTEISSALFQIA